MEIKLLIGISLVCLLGAISPGPSLAIVFRNTISGGRKQGVITSLGHGLGLTLYAFVAIMGLSSLLLANVQIFNFLQWTGALFLIWLAYKMVTFNPSNNSHTEEQERSDLRGFLEGFMTAFLNPKILVFFVAVFSQFINIDITISDRLIIAGMAGIIDTVWYTLVAVVLAETSIIDKLGGNTAIINRTVGIFIFLLGISIIFKTLNFKIF